jgi:hypothetical protein
MPEPTTCSKCGGRMEAGFTTAIGLMGTRSEQDPRLTFVVPGNPVSPNPLKAFVQGLRDEPSDRVFPITGVRCVSCGAVELCAREPK